MDKCTTAVVLAVLLSTTLSHAASKTVGPSDDLSAAIAQLQPGDTLTLKAGTYPGFALGDLSGSEGARITIQGAPGAKVIIDGAKGRPNNFGVITAANPAYVTLAGMEVTFSDPWLQEMRQLDLGSSGAVETFQSRYLGDERIELRGIHFDGGNTGKGIILQGMRIHDVPALGVDNCPGQGSIYRNNELWNLGYPRSGYGFYCSGDGFTFCGNSIHDATMGLTLYDGTGGSLTNSTVVHNILTTISLKPWWHMGSAHVYAAGTGQALYIDPGQGNLVAFNTITHSGVGLVVPEGNTVRNNLVRDNMQDFGEGSMQSEGTFAGETRVPAAVCGGPVSATPPPPTQTPPVVQVLPAPTQLRLIGRQ